MKASGKCFRAALFFAAVFISTAASPEEGNGQARGRISKPGIPVSVTNTKENAVPVKVVGVPRSITHLNVGVRELVNLVSSCVSEPNTGTDRFLYDRNLPFAIPEGYSLVVTDIIAQPGICLSLIHI